MEGGREERGKRREERGEGKIGKEGAGRELGSIYICFVLKTSVTLQFL